MQFSEGEQWYWHSNLITELHNHIISVSHVLHVTWPVCHIGCVSCGLCVTQPVFHMACVLHKRCDSPVYQPLHTLELHLLCLRVWKKKLNIHSHHKCRFACKIHLGTSFSSKSCSLKGNKGKPEKSPLLVPTGRIFYCAIYFYAEHYFVS